MGIFHRFVKKRRMLIALRRMDYRIFWPFLVMATITFSSNWNVPPMGPEIEWIAIDKVAHVAIYGLLATLWVRLGGSTHISSKALAGAAVATLLFGMTDEWMQSRNPVRTFEWADLLADTTGMVLALGAWSLLPWYRRMLEQCLRSRSAPPPPTTASAEVVP